MKSFLFIVTFLLYGCQMGIAVLPNQTPPLSIDEAVENDLREESSVYFPSGEEVGCQVYLGAAKDETLNVLQSVDDSFCDDETRHHIYSDLD